MTGGMTGDRGEGRALTPDDELAVSRMLAEATRAEQIPDDVATRLDEVLEGLVAERSNAPQPSQDDGVDVAEVAEVTELRVRRWPRALLAAAAVLVVGYGVGNVMGQGSLSGTDSASTADEAVAGSAAEEAPQAGQDSATLDEADHDKADQRGAGSEPRGSLADAPQELDTVTDVARFPPRLRSERLDAGVRRALGVLDAQLVQGRLQGDRSRACRPATAVTEADWIPVRYDGRPAVLVRRPAAGGLVEVTIYGCGGAELDRTIVEP